MARSEKAERTTTESATALSVIGGGKLNLGATIERLRAAGKIERRTLPPLVKPGDMPVGAELLAKIVKVIDSINKEIEGRLLWLRNQDGVEFLFPITGQIGQALPKPEDEIGKFILLKRGPDETSAKYKKPMFAFEVWTMSESDLLSDSEVVSSQ